MTFDDVTMILNHSLDFCNFGVYYKDEYIILGSEKKIGNRYDLRRIKFKLSNQCYHNFCNNYNKSLILILIWNILAIQDSLFIYTYSREEYLKFQNYVESDTTIIILLDTEEQFSEFQKSEGHCKLTIENLIT